jgi:hypothetical protein
MAQYHSTTSPVGTKVSPSSRLHAPANQAIPEHDAALTSTLGHQVIHAVGGGSPETPPTSFGSLLGHLGGKVIQFKYSGTYGARCYVPSRD